MSGKTVKVNGQEMPVKEAIKLMKDDKFVVQEFSASIENDNKPSKVTMEGFDIDSEFLIDMAKASDRMNAEVTATFSDCKKLGGKTVVIIVK